MAGVVIRPSVIVDADVVRDLRLEALRDNAAAFRSRYEDLQYWTRSQWEALAAAPATYLAEVDGRVVGHVRGGLGDPDEDQQRRWLYGMFVVLAFRGGLVGPALVDRVLTWARDDGGASLFLNVATSNGRAEAFYRKMGFAPTGLVTPHETREQLWFTEMSRPL